MFNLDEDQPSLRTLATDTHDSLNKINSIEDVRQGHLNMYKLGMTPPQFYL